jgi:hypothetical protein
MLLNQQLPKKYKDHHIIDIIAMAVNMKINNAMLIFKN